MKYILLFTVSFFVSCISKKEEDIVGLWEIISVEYNGEEYLDSLAINAISFEQDKIILPQLKYRNSSSYAYWYFEKEITDSLTIQSTNEIFNGKYKIELTYDSSSQSNIGKLKSLNTLLILQKVDINFDF